MKHPLTAYREQQTPPMTQAALAKSIGVQPNTIWRWENGERLPTSKFLHKLVALTGASVGELLGITDKASRSAK